MSYGKGAPGWVFYPFALFSFLGGAIPLFQGLRWMATGEWYALPLSRALEWMGVYWVPLVESPGESGASLSRSAPGGSHRLDRLRDRHSADRVGFRGLTNTRPCLRSPRPCIS